MTSQNKCIWDLIIIGGGIIGCSAAYYAAAKGLKTLLIERDTVAAAQSGRALGLVRRQGRDLHELPLMIESMDIWRNLERELGRPVGWRQGGNLWCAATEQRLQKLQGWLEATAVYDFGTRLLNPSEIQRIVPDMHGSFLGALYTQDEGMADPVLATRAFAEAAEERGAVIRRDCTVDEILTQAGRVYGVRSGDELIRSSRVFCVAGAGSNALLRPLGLVLPQDWIRASIIRTTPVKLELDTSIVGENIGLRPLADGGLDVYHTTVNYDIRWDSPRYAWWFKHFLLDKSLDLRPNLVSKLSRRRALNRTPSTHIPASWQAPYPNYRTAERALAELQTLFPDLESIDIRYAWGGYIDSTPDMLPVIGPIDTTPGLLVATGYSGHGFGSGPLVGKRLVELSTGVDASIPAKLKPSRFADGSWKDTVLTAI